MPSYCPKCGAINEDQAANCAQCGANLGGPEAVAQAAHAVDRATNKPIGSLVLFVLCAIYLLNPGFGVIDLIPDNLPIIGNLDEGAATYLLLVAMSGLGWITMPRRKIGTS